MSFSWERRKAESASSIARLRLPTSDSKSAPCAVQFAAPVPVHGQCLVQVRDHTVIVTRLDVIPLALTDALPQRKGFAEHGGKVELHRVAIHAPEAVEVAPRLFFRHFHRHFNPNGPSAQSG
jgi:hypothetical protein